VRRLEVGGRRDEERLLRLGAGARDDPDTEFALAQFAVDQFVEPAASRGGIGAAYRLTISISSSVSASMATIAATRSAFGC
jgi:hypothetical protein